MTVPTGVYTLTAEHPSFLAGLVSGVEVLAGEVTTVDFDPTPKVTVEPHTLEAWLLSATPSLTHPSGLEIRNNTSDPLSFRMIEETGPPGALPAPGSAQANHVLNLAGQKEPDGLQEQAELAAPSSAGGPDPFGYTYMDSNEPGGPAFEWVEIAPLAGGSGLPAGLSGVDEGHAWPFDLPFLFNFYGTDYTQVAIGSNGTVYFEDNYLGLNNTVIPGTNSYGVNTFMAHYWDDLVVQGEVYYKDLGNRFVVEYYDVRRYGATGNTGTWEIVLYENGSIQFQFLDASIGGASDYGADATVGIQGNASTGLQYSYNSAALLDGLAICFTYPGSTGCGPLGVPWLWEAPITGTIPALSTANVDVLFTSVVTSPMPVGT
jgi:hypothetical protein